jgi:hypothetical protein
MITAILNSKFRKLFTNLKAETFSQNKEMKNTGSFKE